VPVQGCTLPSPLLEEPLLTQTLTHSGFGALRNETSCATSILCRGFEHQWGVLNVFISISTDITEGMRDFEVMSDKLQVKYVQEARRYCDQADGRSRVRFPIVSLEISI